MDVKLLLKAMAVGLSIAAPVGPIGLLCIRLSFTQGAKYGLAAGLGAATADGLYSCIAAFGLTMVADFLVRYQALLQLVGGVVLCYLGYSTYFAQVADAQASDKTTGLWRAYWSVFLLTITNPLTIFMFMAIFAGLGVMPGIDSYIAASVFVLGVFSGSAAWWLFLSGAVSHYRKAVNPIFLSWINKGAGLALGGFGIAALARLFKLCFGELS